MFASARRFKMLFETDPAIGLDPHSVLPEIDNTANELHVLDCGLWGTHCNKEERFNAGGDFYDSDAAARKGPFMFSTSSR